MLKSSEVLTTVFKETTLLNLNKDRLKSFKTACYRFVGNRFYCCDYRCELMLKHENDKKYYDTFRKNIDLISKVQKNFN